MKKLFILTFGLGLILSLAACSSTPKVSIKMANNWECLEENYYAKDDGFTTIRAEYLNSFHYTDPDEYVERIIAGFKDYTPDAEFSEISHTKAGREDAVEYTVRSGGQIYRDIYIFKGSSVYSIICTALEADYETATTDFQKMIDSFKLR